jgi:uncharacterized protein YkwD
MLLAALLTIALIALAIAPAQAGPRGQMVKTINYVRSWSNLRGLHYSARLSRGAAAWARQLMRSGVLQHSGNALQRGEGEVIEWHTGNQARVNKVVMEWLNSPAHRPVILAGSYRRAGAGIAVGRMGGQKAVIWVARFAR